MCFIWPTMLWAANRRSPIFISQKRQCKMDKNKLSDLAGRLQKGGKGAGIGAGLIAAAGAAVYGLYQSFYTGKNSTAWTAKCCSKCLLVWPVTHGMDWTVTPGEHVPKIHHNTIFGISLFIFGAFSIINAVSVNLLDVAFIRMVPFISRNFHDVTSKSWQESRIHNLTWSSD